MALALCTLAAGGCQVLQTAPVLPPSSAARTAGLQAWVPRELDKATAPMYRVEPSDILTIDVVQQVSQATHFCRRVTSFC